jgi:hypothetical protein
VGAAALFAATLASSGVAGAAEKLGPLVRPLGKAVVDWQQGLVMARAGAAADLRLPGVDAPRAGAVRAARGRAAEVLRVALRKLPLGRGRKTSPGDIDAALARLQVIEPEYQSNGGVWLSAGVRFHDLTSPAPVPKPGTPGPAAPPPTELVLAVASMPLEVAPIIVVAGKRHQLAAAVYRIGRPPKGAGALSVRRNGKGQLVLPRPPPGAGEPPARLDGARALIYVRTPGRP